MVLEQGVGDAVLNDKNRLKNTLEHFIVAWSYKSDRGSTRKSI